MVQLQNPSKRTTLSPRTRVYNGFTGVDFSSDSAKVCLKRSPNSINMYKNYSVEPVSYTHLYTRANRSGAYKLSYCAYDMGKYQGFDSR